MANKGKTADDQIKELFDLLDERRHLPKYKLELRASPFFELFLPQVLTKRYSEKGGYQFTQRDIIPELPYKTYKDKNGRTLCHNVDFFAVSEDGNCALLIELKTDKKSVDGGQAKDLKDAGTRIRDLVGKAQELASRENADKKYRKLKSRLEGLPKVTTKIAQVVYIAPERISGVETIDFIEFADTIGGDSDPIRARFADSLRKWVTPP